MIHTALGGALLLLLSCAAIAAFATFHRQTTSQAEAIVVLGAGMDPDGSLHAESVARATTGIALFHAGVAPRIHFSGGRARADGPGAGDQMAAIARAHGIPEHAITTENQSLSTLQNALYSMPMLRGKSSIILVSEAFHLPRAKISFWWMGYDRISLFHSARFRRTQDGQISVRMLARETAALWFNLARATLWTATGRKHHALLQ